MIEIDNQAWEVMVRHAEATYPVECCGIMIGSIDGDRKRVVEARALENAYTGGQEDRYEIRPTDLLLLDTTILVHWARQDRTGQYLKDNYLLDQRLEKPLFSTVCEGEILALAKCWKWGAPKLMTLAATRSTQEREPPCQRTPARRADRRVRPASLRARLPVLRVLV